MVVTVLPWVGCQRAAENASSQEVSVRLASGSALSVPLAREYKRLLPRVNIQLVESGQTSGDTIEAIRQGAVDFGFVAADAAYFAYAGLVDPPEPIGDLRAVSVLQLDPLHLLVGANSGIRDIKDLQGRRVRVGPRERGHSLVVADTHLIADLVLRALGVDPDAVLTEQLSLDQATARIVDGRLDAMFLMTNYPGPRVYNAIRQGARLLPIQGAAIDALRRQYPFVRLVSIPARPEQGQMHAVHTIGVHRLLICRRGLDEQLVYDLTKYFFEALPQLSSAQASLRSMDPNQAPATPIPLHDGASRYYRERELFR